MAKNGDIKILCVECGFTILNPMGLLACPACNASLDWFRKPAAIFEGIKVYDPRDGQLKVSDNPALVMADLANRGAIKTPWKFDDIFWVKIGKLADFCDEKMP